MALLMIAGTSCRSSTGLAEFQPEIRNTADNFQAQATQVSNVSGTYTYTWSNGGARATVDHSTTTTSGAAMLVIKDAAGATVYNRPLSSSLNEPTSAGQAGAWTIQFTLTNYSGTLNFRAQKLLP